MGVPYQYHVVNSKLHASASQVAATMATSTNVASAVHLISGRINLGLIWQTSRQELEGLLGQKDTKKVELE